MKDEVYNVKLAPEIKKSWQEMVERVTQQYDLNKLGEAYPIMLDIVEANLKDIAPDFQSYINNVMTNTSAIQKTVMAMNDVYKSYQENQMAAQEEAQKGLADQINTLSKENTELKKLCNQRQEVINEKDVEIEELKKELQNYKEQVEQDNQISELLDSVKKLINKKEN